MFLNEVYVDDIIADGKSGEEVKRTLDAMFDIKDMLIAVVSWGNIYSR